MIVYLVGVHRDNADDVLIRGDLVSVLTSYGWFHDRDVDRGFEMLVEGSQIGTVKSHFLDSGAFTLRTVSVKWGIENNRPWRDYYDTDEFWRYMDDYAAFIKQYQDAIDLYANVDVIPDPVLTWRNQKYLEEKHGLKPVPVVHFLTDLKWLKRYMDCGYELIGLGGLVKAEKKSRLAWLDRCFEMVSDNDGYPIVKLHGFGMTSYTMLIRYPWWSVDSVSWALAGGLGKIFVPHKRRGYFTFGVYPYVIGTSVCSVGENHYLSMSSMEQRVIDEWLCKIGVPLGRMEGEEIAEFGVMTRHTERRLANLLFFEELCKWLPEWPWPFRIKSGRGFW